MDPRPLSPLLLNPDGSLESTTRLLLALLESLTDLDSVLLNWHDRERQTLEILFASNRHPDRIRFDEGAVTEWKGALCQRAYEEGVRYTRFADVLWGDIQGVRDTGLLTYLAEPVRGRQHELLGTLCAVSTRRVPVGDDVLRTMHLFAGLIAHHMEREKNWTRLQLDNAELASRATTDPLTGIANRRGLVNELNRALFHAEREGGRVAVVFIDLIRFKEVNDRYGHRVGDGLLVAMAGRLALTTRADEVLARYGGDEFVVVASFPPRGGDPRRLTERFAAAAQGRYELDALELDYAGASVGVAVSEPGETAGALLERADRAMYAAKRGEGGAVRV